MLVEWARRRRADDRGALSLEAALAGGVVIVMLAIAIGVGLISTANQAVEMAAFEAAREASIARTSTEAKSRATSTARRMLREQGFDCAQLTVNVNTNQFSRRVGRDARVRTSVQCRVPLRQLASNGVLPGSRTLSAEAESVIDTYRDRD